MAKVTPSPMGVFDDPKYSKLALNKSEKYQKAEPFPHIYFDEFLDRELADRLISGFPEPQKDWISANKEETRKKYQHDETKLPNLIREMLRELNSRQFLLFLETLTGIENLLPDPYFLGGGAHVASRGDYLEIHADFNWHHKLQAHRRVNALLYLSESWEESWNGGLELWDKDMNTCVETIFPIPNRLTVFSTSEYSNHGHPTPLTTPDGVYRNVLNVYYYTTHASDFDTSAPHFTEYRTQASPFSVELLEKYKDN